MPWVLLASLASSVISFTISNITHKPAITINQADVSAEASKELQFFKIGFFALTGLLAVYLLKKVK